ncbi:hypothetical protein RQP46_009622 [Phenoliferia psychrophenolica]
MSSIGLGRPAPSSTKSSHRANSRHPRVSSQAAYSVFEPSQIQTFKEAFSLIDADGDGIISEADLKALYASLGQPAPKELLSKLLADRPSSNDPSSLQPTQINFSLFLTLMSEHLSTLDTEPDMLEAFSSFDDDDRGFVKGTELREALKGSGDRMTDAEIDRLLSGPFMDKHGMFNYRLFCSTLRVAEGDDEVGA